MPDTSCRHHTFENVHEAVYNANRWITALWQDVRLTVARLLAQNICLATVPLRIWLIGYIATDYRISSSHASDFHSFVNTHSLGIFVSSTDENHCRLELIFDTVMDSNRKLCYTLVNAPWRVRWLENFHEIPANFARQSRAFFVPEILLMISSFVQLAQDSTHPRRGTSDHERPTMLAHINVFSDSMKSGGGGGGGGLLLTTYRNWKKSTMRDDKITRRDGQESKRWGERPTFAFALSVWDVRLCQSHTFTIASKA